MEVRPANLCSNNVINLTIKTPPHRSCFAFLVYKDGVVALINQGVGVGLGSAALSTSSTGRRKSVGIGVVSGGKYFILATPLIIADEPCLQLPKA